jgi:hypothetical protein
MKVKIFMDALPNVVEERVNHWLESEAASAHIIKTETAVVVAAPGQDGRTYPYIVATIWYEP